MCRARDFGTSQIPWKIFLINYNTIFFSFLRYARPVEIDFLAKINIPLVAGWVCHHCRWADEADRNSENSLNGFSGLRSHPNGNGRKVMTQKMPFQIILLSLSFQNTLEMLVWLS